MKKVILILVIHSLFVPKISFSNTNSTHDSIILNSTNNNSVVLKKKKKYPIQRQEEIDYIIDPVLYYKKLMFIGPKFYFGIIKETSEYYNSNAGNLDIMSNLGIGFKWTYFFSRFARTINLGISTEINYHIVKLIFSGKDPTGNNFKLDRHYLNIDCLLILKFWHPHSLYFGVGITSDILIDEPENPNFQNLNLDRLIIGLVSNLGYMLTMKKKSLVLFFGFVFKYSKDTYIKSVSQRNLSFNIEIGFGVNP